MICTIHQPNLVPWFPFFQKMAAADVFVVLTDCQYEKGGYQNRFRVDGEWYTMPVSRGLEPICDKEYVKPVASWEKLIRKIGVRNERYAEVLGEWRKTVGVSLAQTNVGIIMDMVRRLGIPTMVRIGAGHDGDAVSSERLAQICASMDCDTYLSGPSGRKYLDEAPFRSRGIGVQYVNPAEQTHVSGLEAVCAL